MRTFMIDGRAYRTDGVKSPVSGRLRVVESLRDDGQWKTVRNISRRDQVLARLEAEPVA